jgi:hypothetical protein
MLRDRLPGQSQAVLDGQSGAQFEQRLAVALVQFIQEHSRPGAASASKTSAMGGLQASSHLYIKDAEKRREWRRDRLPGQYREKGDIHHFWNAGW